MSLLRNIGVGRKKLIEDWIDQHVNYNGSWSINENMEIDVEKDCRIIADQIPDYIQFGKVTGTFSISYTEISSLRGAPRECSILFCLKCPNLYSLQYCPKIKYSIHCSDNFCKTYIRNIVGDGVKIYIER